MNIASKDDLDDQFLRCEQTDYNLCMKCADKLIELDIDKVHATALDILNGDDD